GAWLEYETDSNDVISVRVDRTRKQPVTVLLRALGIGTDAEIIAINKFSLSKSFSSGKKIISSFPIKLKFCTNSSFLLFPYNDSL
ncbi:hypothetical protein ACTPEF_25880, partial [Clostridioides difficile]